MRKLGKIKLFSSKEIEKSRVSIGFECMERGVIRPEMCYDPLGMTGVKWARVQTGWAKCETEKGVYTWDWLDCIVDNLLTRGVQPWFDVTYGNPLYMPNATNPTAVGHVPLLYGEETWKAWLGYVHALSEHFKGRVQKFEIWNEPDGINFWYPGKPSGAELATLVTETGREIRKVIPEAQIGTDTAECKDHAYLHDLFDHLHPEEFNFFCMHDYQKLPEIGNVATNYNMVREMLDARGFQNTEIWMGEGGHASWHHMNHWMNPEGTGSEHRQAVWMLRRYLLDLKMGIAYTSFFQIADMWERSYQMAIVTRPKAAAQGILNGKTYTPKKACETISLLSVLLSGDLEKANVARELTDCASFSVGFTRNGKPVFAYWEVLPVNEERPVAEKCAVRLAEGVSMPHPVLIDGYTREVFELEEGEEEHLPLGEYPFLLTDRDTYAIEE